MRRIHRHLTYSNVMVTLLAFVVLGGGAYAAFRLPKNSVRSRNIVNGQVKKSDLADGAVNGKKIGPDSINSGHIVDGQVQTSDLAQPTAHSAGVPNDPSTSCSGVTNKWRSLDALGRVGYYRDLEGRVHLQGIAEECGNPSSSTMFTLPAGFRPAHSFNQFAIVDIHDTSPNALVVTSAGDVYPVLGGPGTEPSLDGVSFRCGPSGQNGCP
jgi:hypothetical protein